MLIELGILLIFLGFILIFITIILGLLRNKGRVKTGGVLLIGPIPIVFGSDKDIVKLSIILTIITLLIFILPIILLFMR